MITIDWSPEPIVVAEDFFAAAAAVEDLEVPLMASIPVVSEGIQSIFDAEGPGWAPWAESYAPIAEAENVGILHKTGALRSGAANPSSYAVAGDTLGFTGGSAPDYWLFHQTGTRMMPARPFISLTPESEVGVMEIFETWLIAIVNATD